MGRLKVTHPGKIKSNRPITRIGKKQYLKRRFAHVRKLENIHKKNPNAVEYMGRKFTAMQNYTRHGLNVDPTARKEIVKERKKKIKPKDRGTFREPEGQKGTVGQPVSEEEGTMICNLMQKYDTNFKRMSLDRKLNPMQLTPKQLQRRVVNYMKWEKEAFPEMYAEAESNGLTLEDYSDPKLRQNRKIEKEDVVEEEE